ncbi:MAG: efflux RND transporter periplasmic adaptor subunit [bacterium]|nr:efflux RND transporter periplasmic adaptor subunit [bacterium]
MQFPSFLTRSKIIIIVAVAVIGVGGFLYFNRTQTSSYETVAVKRGTLTQEVSVTGTVTPVKSAVLAFEKGGKIKGIYVDVGQRVVAGQVLAETDNAELKAGILDAEANLAAENAKLAEFKRGSRPEELQVSETKVANAKISQMDADQNLRDKIGDAYTKADDAVRNQVDQFMSNPRTSTPQLNFVVADEQLRINIVEKRYVIELLFLPWQKDISLLGNTLAPKQSGKLAQENLATIKGFLDKVALAVNAITPSGTLSQTTIDNYKGSITTARSNINTAIVNLTAAEEKFRTADGTLLLAQNELTLKQAGTNEEQIAGQEARVKQAEAKVETAHAQFEKTILRSPISGVITKKDTRVGEIISGNGSVLSVITDQNLELDVNIPETDIAKIKIGNTATVTLDAYGDGVIFGATIGSIDPAATVIESVPTYKTTLYFIKYDSKVKSGMTANIDILTNKRENTLSVPTRAITMNGVGASVNVENSDHTIRTIPVTIGMKSSDGRTEIIDGLKEGDRVILNTQ